MRRSIYLRTACGGAARPAFAGLASVALPLLLLTSAAYAGRSSGGSEGRGGGRLGSVSSGVGRSVGDNGGGGGGGGGGSRDDTPRPRDDVHGHRYYDDHYHREIHGTDIVYLDDRGNVVRRFSKPPEPEVNRLAARFDLFLGVQKVIESDTSFTASLAISDDWFRLAGNYTRYWEERMDGNGKLTVSMPSLTLGIPIQQGGGSRAFLEGGVVHAGSNNDPMQDWSITGGKIGLHLEQPVRRVTLLGDAHALLFEDNVYAYEARFALRFKNLEAGIRVLDFNVGPALFGPELGVAF